MSFLSPSVALSFCGSAFLSLFLWFFLAATLFCPLSFLLVLFRSVVLKPLTSEVSRLNFPWLGQKVFASNPFSTWDGHVDCGLLHQAPTLAKERCTLCLKSQWQAGLHCLLAKAMKLVFPSRWNQSWTVWSWFLSCNKAGSIPTCLRPHWGRQLARERPTRFEQGRARRSSAPWRQLWNS